MLLSAYPEKLIFSEILKNVSQILILNKSSPRIDPCETTQNNVSHELKAESTLLFV